MNQKGAKQNACTIRRTVDGCHRNESGRADRKLSEKRTPGIPGYKKTAEETDQRLSNAAESGGWRWYSYLKRKRTLYFKRIPV